MSNLQKWMSKNQSQLPRPFSGRQDPGWTEYSIAVRLPEIVKRVIAENAYPAEINDRLETLRGEIPYKPLREIYPDGYGDWDVWNGILAAYKGMNWFETPWLVCEFYVYRRILESIGYFNEGPFRAHDPFAFQKSEGLVASLKPIHEMLVWMEQLKSKGTPVKAMLGELLTHNLEGNRVDLSLWPVKDGQDQNSQKQTIGENPMLVNDLPAALDWMFSHPVRQVDLLMDNAGFEMLSDLCMLAFLLDQGVIEQAVLHVKPYPVFVSDVIEDDVYHSIHLLKGQMDKYPQLAALGEQLESHLSAGAIRIRREGFWGLPFAFWEMDRGVEENLSRADLIISKGDANYRRLVGDRRWDYQKPFSSVVSYMPVPLLAIRVIKSEPGAGYPLADFSRMTQTDPEWMRNGKWGSIQFWDGQQGV